MRIAKLRTRYAHYVAVLMNNGEVIVAFLKRCELCQDRPEKQIVRGVGNTASERVFDALSKAEGLTIGDIIVMALKLGVTPPQGSDIAHTTWSRLQSVLSCIGWNVRKAQSCCG